MIAEEILGPYINDTTGICFIHVGGHTNKARKFY